MTDLENDLRQWMKTQRKSLGITQAEIGKELNLTKDKICKIEAGTRRIQWNEGWKIITFLEARDRERQARPTEPPPIPRRLAD